MPKTKSAQKTLQDFKDQYGEEQGERIYYATAKKQGRDPDTFKKESLKLVDDVMVEHSGQMFTIKAGTIFETVGTGAVAMIPTALGSDNKNDEDDDEDEDEVEEASNSQASELNLDY